MISAVTVEASSPALIEQARSVVTDGAGRCAIIDLGPGTYTVTFTLSGFRSVTREGIVLEGAFAAQVNGSLTVGAVEETVTVSETVGALYFNPQAITQGRRAQFGAQVDW